MSIAMVANAQRYDWSTWGMGILRSVIQGGAGAVVATPTAMALAPTAFNFGDQIFHTLLMIVITFLGAGGLHMMMFLQTHPAPEIVTTKFTETETTKVGTGDQSATVTHQSTAETTTVKPASPPDSPKA